MRNTIKAKSETGYRIENGRNRITHEPLRALYDGSDLLMVACVKTLDDHKDEMECNEMYHICEVFTTAKGNQFIYARDEETDEDFLIKIER